MNPLDRLAKAQAELEQAQLAVRAAHCREVGCDMQSVGGKSAACCDTCQCSVPVNVCTKCGDCDYGDNAWAKKTVEECEARIEMEELDRIAAEEEAERIRHLKDEGVG